MYRMIFRFFFKKVDIDKNVLQELPQIRLTMSFDNPFYSVDFVAGTYIKTTLSILRASVRT